MSRLIFNPLTRQIWIGLEGESGGQGDPPPADAAAPEQETTAVPDSVDPEKPEEQTEDPPEPKTFTQAELDEVLAKRLGRERRKWDREHATQTSEKPVSTEPVKPEQFETWDDYAEAKAEQIAAHKVQERDVQRQQRETLSGYADRIEEAKEKYDDFEQVAQNRNLPVTSEMASAIVTSEIGPDILYHLGSNPKEADRIARLSPVAQVKEIGKLEAKLTAEPPTKKVSSAPAPITPVKANGQSRSFDTTDPRSIASMSDSEWIEADRARQRRNFKVQQQS